MKLIRQADVMSDDVLGAVGHFDRNPRQRMIAEFVQPDQVRVSILQFEDGAYSGWHSHRGGQVLHILSGMARAECRGLASIVLSTGDTIWTLPNEEHRHGAADHTDMLQFTVTVGITDWGNRSED